MNENEQNKKNYIQSNSLSEFGYSKKVKRKNIDLIVCLF